MANAPPLRRPADVATEAAARVELAALYRLVEHLNWGEGIFNHIALRVPGEPDKFLIKKHELTYEEVTASNLVKVDCNGDFDERYGVNDVGFNTHAPIMRARPDLDCSIHLHTTPIMAIAAHPKGLRMLNVQSVQFYNNVAYQDFSRGSDQQAIIDDLGDKRVIVFRHHGAVITGRSAEDAFTTAKRFVTACEVQLAIESAGQGDLEIPDPIAKKMADQMAHHDSGRGGADWPAWLRRLDRIDPSYKN
jgi:ribulose-5-phosphate 4-epimerase/fuculose-1-phosphate aldolase